MIYVLTDESYLVYLQIQIPKSKSFYFQGCNIQVTGWFHNRYITASRSFAVYGTQKWLEGWFCTHERATSWRAAVDIRLLLSQGTGAIMSSWWDAAAVFQFEFVVLLE